MKQDTNKREEETDSYQTNEVVQKKLCCHGELGLWLKRLFFLERKSIRRLKELYYILFMKNDQK